MLRELKTMDIEVMKAGTNLWIWLVTQFQKDQTEGLHKGEEGVRREGAGPTECRANLRRVGCKSLRSQVPQ